MNVVFVFAYRENEDILEFAAWYLKTANISTARDAKRSENYPLS